MYDPEIPVNIYDLGLIYEINLDEWPIVTVTHTLTSAFCPASDDIVAGIFFAAVNVEGVANVYVNTVFDPPFSFDKMSDDAKLHAMSQSEPNIYVGKDGLWRLAQEGVFNSWNLKLSEPYYTMYLLDHEIVKANWQGR